MSRDRGSHFLLFGSELDIGSCRTLVERALGLSFEAHDSDFAGSYYLAGLPGGEHYELRPNKDAEGKLVEPDFSSFSTLLYANETSRPDGIREALAHARGLVQLRSEHIE